MQRQKRMKHERIKMEEKLIRYQEIKRESKKIQANANIVFKTGGETERRATCTCKRKRCGTEGQKKQNMNKERRET